MTPKIHSFRFGAIAVGGRRYHRDIVIYPNGRVEERKGGL